MLKANEIKKALSLLRENYHDSTTALNYNSPFQLLVATMLAAQSTDIRVNIVTKTLFQRYKTPADFLNLSQTELEEQIKTVGLYRAKARNILATCFILQSEFGGEFPLTRDKLMQLPGVGRKTANVVLSIAADFDAIAVDTHVFRVSNRIGLAQAKNVRDTEEHLMQNIPQSEWSEAHHWLIWHGRKICRARKPLCISCFLNEICRYNRKTNHL